MFSKQTCKLTENCKYSNHHFTINTDVNLHHGGTNSCNWLHTRAKYRRFQSTTTFDPRRFSACRLKIWDNVDEILPYDNFHGSQRCGKVLTRLAKNAQAVRMQYSTLLRALLFGEMRVGDRCCGNRKPEIGALIFTTIIGEMILVSFQKFGYHRFES